MRPGSSSRARSARSTAVCTASSSSRTSRCPPPTCSERSARGCRRRSRASRRCAFAPRPPPAAPRGGRSTTRSPRRADPTGPACRSASASRSRPCSARAPWISSPRAARCTPPRERRKPAMPRRRSPWPRPSPRRPSPASWTARSSSPAARPSSRGIRSRASTAASAPGASPRARPRSCVSPSRAGCWRRPNPEGRRLIHAGIVLRGKPALQYRHGAGAKGRPGRGRAQGPARGDLRHGPAHLPGRPRSPHAETRHHRPRDLRRGRGGAGRQRLRRGRSRRGRAAPLLQRMPRLQMGAPYLCYKLQVRGVELPGGMQEYWAVPTERISRCRSARGRPRRRDRAARHRGSHRHAREREERRRHPGLRRRPHRRAHRDGLAPSGARASSCRRSIRSASTC